MIKDLSPMYEIHLNWILMQFKEVLFQIAFLIKRKVQNNKEKGGPIVF